MARKRIFEYAIIKHPTEKEAKDGAKSEFIKKPDTILAKDEREVLLLSAREIPEDADLDNVEIAVRPF